MPVTELNHDLSQKLFQIVSGLNLSEQTFRCLRLQEEVFDIWVDMYAHVNIVYCNPTKLPEPLQPMRRDEGRWVPNALLFEQYNIAYYSVTPSEDGTRWLLVGGENNLQQLENFLDEIIVLLKA
jgi:hypothetical protein